MDTRTRKKLVGFAALIVLYFLVAGSDIELRRIRKLMLVYVTGACIAFWTEREPIGTFRPISMRPLAILIGSIMMIYALSMMLIIKEALPRRDHAPTAALTLQSPHPSRLNPPRAPRDSP